MLDYTLVPRDKEEAPLEVNIQELQTVVRGHLPMKLVILDNGSHGNVRQLQEQAFGRRYGSQPRL
jgi:acetolactate synthase-1/2/3 large subunit